MKALLVKLAEALIPYLLKMLADVFSKEVKKYEEEKKRAERIEDMARAKAKHDLAKTKEERIRAAKDIINGTNTPSGE